VDAAVEAGSILLRRIEGMANGAHVVASGMLGEGGRLSDGVLSLATSDASPLAVLLPNSWRATRAFWHGPAKLEVQATGPQEALAVRVRLALADARLEARPTIDLRSGEWAGAVTLHHPGARRLVAVLGLAERAGMSGLPEWLGDGSLSLVAHLAAAPGRIAAETFDLTAASLRATGNLALDVGGEEPHLTGRVFADAVSVLLPDARSDVPLPLGILHGWRGDLRVEMGSVLGGQRPVLRDASADVTLQDDAAGSSGSRENSARAWLRAAARRDGAARPPDRFAAGAAERCRDHRSVGRCAHRSAVRARRCQPATDRERLQPPRPSSRH
jgi:hypothetical protein